MGRDLPSGLFPANVRSRFFVLPFFPAYGLFIGRLCDGLSKLVFGTVVAYGCCFRFFLSGFLFVSFFLLPVYLFVGVFAASLPCLTGLFVFNVDFAFFNSGEKPVL